MEPSKLSIDEQNSSLATDSGENSQNVIIGYNDSHKNDNSDSSLKLTLLYPILIIGSNLLISSLLTILLRLINNRILIGSKAILTLSDLLKTTFLPTIVTIFGIPIVTIVFGRMLIKYLTKSKSYIDIGYLIILQLVIGSTFYLFFIGISAFLPVTYNTLAPIGIIFAMLMFGPPYYLIVYFVIKDVKRRKFLVGSEDLDYNNYAILESTLLLLRRLSYIGIVGAILIPIIVTIKPGI